MALQWIVSQVGGRQHYATPRAFQRSGELKVLYTDAWTSGWRRSLLKYAPGKTKALAGRYSPEIPPEKVVSFTPTALYDAISCRWRNTGRSQESAFLEYARQGKHFAECVNRHLFRQPALSPKSDAFYGFFSVSLETLQRLRDQDIFTVVDQGDPARVEQRLVAQERQRWPNWEASPGRIPEAYFERCSEEWATASVVLVYSRWTKEAIVEQGVPAEKVIVVPLAYDVPPSADVPPAPKAIDRPLTVLYLGTVMLRKGIQYFLEAARLLKDRKIRFVVAGSLQISQQAVSSAPSNVTFIGRVIRTQADEVYRQADVFVLPTISDSFALTQVEAMAQGLPVIATTRCGEVVTDGVDGRIVPPGDADAIAKAIGALDDDRKLLAEMSANARMKSRQFSFAQYAERLRQEVFARRSEMAG
jgi:glycosyltransferase involved in cell wall biosynthesis